MKIILQFVLFMVILCSCGQETREHKYRYQFNVKSEDTTKNYTIFSNLNYDYDYFDKKGIDSIILHKEEIKKINGEFYYGFVNTKKRENKLLCFFSNSRELPSFPDKKQELQTAWTQEIKDIYHKNSPIINLYESDEYIKNNIPGRYSSFLIIDANKRDTLGFQEINYVITQERLVAIIVFYSSQTYRKELFDIVSNLKANKDVAQKNPKDTLTD